jgi:hypothetical protein
MPLEIIIALVVALPVFAFITAFVWYVNLGGAWAALRKTGKKSRSAGNDRLETEKA